MSREDLNIEFRAIPYATFDHALQYRVDPNDERNYYEETKTKRKWFRLTKYKVKKQYDNCDWITVKIFVGWENWAEYESHVNWQPIWIRNKEDLECYKNKYKTIGQFESHLKDEHDKTYEKWSKDREAYLNTRKPIY